MSSIGARAVSALLLSAALAFLFWLRPGLEPGMLASTPENSMFGTRASSRSSLSTGRAGLIRSRTADRQLEHAQLDNHRIGHSGHRRAVRHFRALCRFLPLSSLNLLLAVMTWPWWSTTCGCSAERIQVNRLTDEFKAER